MNPKTHMQLHSDHLAEKSEEDPNLNSSPQHPEETGNLVAGQRRSKYPPIVKGMRYNRLVAQSIQIRGSGRTSWLFLCDCGNTKIAKVSDVRRGLTKSCGCLCSELTAALKFSHGLAKTPTYRSWSAMWFRCTDPKCYRYDRYGGRGIKICDEWKSVEKFLSDMGERPSLRHSLDRINNDGNYEPGNCRWSTKREQAQNTSRNINLTFNGLTMCLTEWARTLGIDPTTLVSRMRNGWDVDEMLTTPLDKRYSRCHSFKK